MFVQGDTFLQSHHVDLYHFIYFVPQKHHTPPIHGSLWQFVVLATGKRYVVVMVHVDSYPIVFMRMDAFDLHVFDFYSFHVGFNILLLMAEILHHLGYKYMKPYK